MSSDWDNIGKKILGCKQTKESQLTDWGYSHPINAYEALITKNVRSCREKVAFISYEDRGSFNYSYAEVDKQTKMIVSLLEQHVSQQERILIIGPPCAATTFTILASSFLGCEHTVVIPSTSEDSIKKIINQFNPRAIIICNTNNKQNYGGIPTIRLESDNNKIKADGEEIVGTTDLNSYTYNPEDSLFSLFTSGTTGQPKKITHGAYGYLLFAAYTIEYYFNFQANSCILCGSEAGWINGHTYSIYGPLLKDGTSILIQDPSRLSSIEYLLEIAKNTNLTILYLPVTTIRLLKAIDFSANKKSNQIELLSVKTVGSMGEMLAPVIERWYRQRFTNTSIPVVNTYFQTETGGILCAKRWNDKPGIVEGEIGQIPWYLEVKTDEQGQLLLAKSLPGLMINVSSRDKDSHDLNRYYYNKDTNYLLHDNGKIIGNILYVSGRNDDVLKIKGVRIASGQIEAAALESPYIIECAAIEAEGRLGIPEIILFATLNKQINLSNNQDDLLRSLNELMQAKVGTHIKISKIKILESMPKTHSGKIKRNYLRQCAASS